MHVTDRPRDVLVRFAPMIYGPTVLFALGEGAVIPLIPVIAAQLGADLATAALVASALVVGQLCGNIPAGWAVARIGERFTMVIAGALSLAAVVGLALAPSLGVFALAVFVIGFCAAAFGLARHSFMTTRVPLEFRARALSLLGGTFRLGMFIGPFVAAALLALFGDEHATIWFFGACLIATILLVLLGPDPERAVAAPTLTHGDSTLAEDTGEAVSGSIPTTERTGVFRTMWAYRRVLSRLGLAAASLSAVRSARQVVLPLWGVSLGLDAQTIALVVGISGAIDFALFYASGQVMDRFGRLWVAVPSMLTMATALALLPLAQTVPAVAVVAALLGIGNGMGSGIVMTLGADVAPADVRPTFLSVWRLFQDTGDALGPLVLSAGAALGSLAAGIWAASTLGGASALALRRWVPRYSALADLTRRGRGRRDDGAPRSPQKAVRDRGRAT